MLYLTYDGLLDPLGGSQIIPYVKGLSSPSRKFYILSFEKRKRIIDSAAAMRNELQMLDIGWTFLVFTERFGILGKLWDLMRLYLAAARIALHRGIGVVHARGHAAAKVGALIKHFTGAKFIFDFRGLWADERVDKGGWDLSKFFHRVQYQHFKRSERRLLVSVDQIVVLTDAVVEEIRRISATSISKINVIPCCADFDHFRPQDVNARSFSLNRLAIPPEARVLGYLGSIGRLYQIDRFLRLFEIAANIDDSVYGLVITTDVEAFAQLVERFVPHELRSRIKVHSATRAEVPIAICGMDVSVCFIETSYARIAASPTKLAECFAMGIPAICNAGVGDVEEQVRMLGGGIVVDPKSDEDLLKVAGKFSQIAEMGGTRLREAARPLLGLEFAISRYQRVYDNLLTSRLC